MLPNLRKKYLLIAAAGGALAAIISFGNNLVDLYAKIKETKPVLVQFALSESSFGYKDSIESRFAINDVRLRTFQQIHPLNSPPRLVLSYTIQNTSDDELLVTGLIFNIAETGQVMSLTPKPLEPNKTYSHELIWVVGQQNKKLVPVYSIPAKTTGAFNVEITASGETPPGAGVIASTAIETNMGDLETEKVQIYLPVSKQLIGQNGIEDSPVSSFKRMSVGEVVEHHIVDNILESSKLKSLVESADFDALEKDFMFHKAALYDFGEYKKILSHEGKSYEELFPEENLKYFWSSARTFLDNRNESSNKRVN